MDISNQVKSSTSYIYGVSTTMDPKSSLVYLVHLLEFIRERIKVEQNELLREKSNTGYRPRESSSTNESNDLFKDNILWRSTR